MMQSRESGNITRVYGRFVLEEEIEEWDRADRGGAVERELPAPIHDSRRGTAGEQLSRGGEIVLRGAEVEGCLRRFY